MLWSPTLFVCFSLPVLAQDDSAQLEKIFLNLRSTDRKIRNQAFTQLRNNPKYIEDPRTPEQLLDFLAFEEERMRSRAKQGLDVEDELHEEASWFIWNIWKDRLTPQAFLIFARGSYNTGSRFARELGARAGRFVMELLAIATSQNEFERENATALAGYALAEDQKSSVKLTDEEREALKRRLVAASTDLNLGVRYAVINSLALIGGRWSLDLLEQMYEREHTFHPAGENPLYLESDLKLIKEAMRKVQATLDRPAR